MKHNNTARLHVHLAFELADAHEMLLKLDGIDLITYTILPNILSLSTILMHTYLALQ